MPSHVTTKATAGVGNYALVTAAYWVFTLTDGALRMLVLLHFHGLGYSPLQLASLFLLYELCGVFTNFGGGLIALRFGLRSTLLGGLLLQAVALAALSLINPEWSVGEQVLFALLTQGLSGVAKDLTKLSAKTTLKYLVPESAQSKLFAWVAILTGSKNALKGAGFFLGGSLLTWGGFQLALWLMAGAVVAVFLAMWLLLPAALGRAKKATAPKQVWSRKPSVNSLSAARLFLFGARDIWFVVALPVFLHETLGWRFVEVGSFMALWVIGYGLVQSCAPRVLGTADTDYAQSARRWIIVLSLVPLLIVFGLRAGADPGLVVVLGLAIFGAVFALNSAVHSYLILAYCSRSKAPADVGFYYSANATGRLLGTVLSGWVYQTWGLEACLLVSSVMLVLAAFFSRKLPSPMLPEVV